MPLVANGGVGLCPMIAEGSMDPGVSSNLLIRNRRIPFSDGSAKSRNQAIIEEASGLTGLRGGE